MHTIEEDVLEIETDVLVIGGGPAAAWAAISAAERGAQVVVADKGFLGTSGAFAAAGSSHKVLPPLADLRDEAKLELYAAGGQLSQFGWWDRLLEITYDRAHLVYQWAGYDVPIFGRPGPSAGMRGFEVMHVLRKRLLKQNVQILDQSPALELLVDPEGTVVGANGYMRRFNRPWCVRAGAVVLASGGTAWLSKALGCSNNTGDGLLMAVEAGGDLSGMEFSAHYAPCPANGPIGKSSIQRHATYLDKEGRIVGQVGENGMVPIAAIAKEMKEGPVYCRLDRETSDPLSREVLRTMDPAFFATFDAEGIDPFSQPWPISLVMEGTVRGTGGIRVADKACGTSVRGLFVAGDAASRELLSGGVSGGAGQNMTWAIGSAHVAGRAAADFSRSLGESMHDRPAEPVGSVGLKGDGPQWDAMEIVRAVQEEVFPFERNLFRTEKTLLDCLARLETSWKTIQGAPLRETAHQLVRSREAASLLATARWSFHAALHRTETRGMHIRLDHPTTDPTQHHYLSVGGLDRIWTKPIELPRSADSLLEMESQGMLMGI
jgi:succinate dehydrogenase/fumarate reductase flavoprotein subunit